MKNEGRLPMDRESSTSMRETAAYVAMLLGGIAVVAWLF
jgi:hypothetical protein